MTPFQKYCMDVPQNYPDPVLSSGVELLNSQANGLTSTPVVKILFL